MADRQILGFRLQCHIQIKYYSYKLIGASNGNFVGIIDYTIF